MVKKLEDNELEKIREKKIRDLKRRILAGPEQKLEKRIVELNSNNFNQVVNGNEWVIVDCWAEWCMPCKIMGPVFEKLSNEYRKVTFAKLNTDQNQQIAMQCEIMAIPTFLLFHKGKIVQKLIGAVGESGLRKVLNNLNSID